jgi:hypothetical protein
MKCCESCGTEICTKDGENKCRPCEDGKRKKKATLSRKQRDSIMEGCGLVKVRGALGGTYWE